MAIAERVVELIENVNEPHEIYGAPSERAVKREPHRRDRHFSLRARWSISTAAGR
jgi:hypothetical protein